MSHKGLVFWVVAGLVAVTARADCPLPNPANCIYVDDNCTPPGAGTAGNPFCTITDAYAAATPGATILVKAGTYNECVRASGFVSPGDPGNQDKPVNLIADEWQKNQLPPTNPAFDTVAALTVIDGTGVCDGVFPQPSQSTVFLAGTNASLKGFKVTGAGASGVAGFGSVAITNNLITGNVSELGGGVYFYSASCVYGDVSATIANNKVTGNFADDLNENGSGSGGGIWVWARGSEPDLANDCVGGTADVAVSGNVVTSNQASNTVIDPLVLDETSNGGGIYALTDTPLPAAVPASASAAHVAITQNVIASNEVVAGSGGSASGAGIFANTFSYGMETLEIRDNTVGPGNLAHSPTGYGGGISAWVTPVAFAQHKMIVDGNSITGNFADYGAGMDLLAFVQQLGTNQSFSLVASGNTVTGNQSNFDGGGLHVDYTSWRSATVADGTTNPTPAAEMTFLLQRNTVRNNIGGLGGGGGIVYASADADPDGQTLCSPSLQAATTAHVQFADNLIAENTANNVDPVQSSDIIGAGLLVLPSAFGEATATVSVSTSTITKNDIGPNGGFVGGIEVAGVTDFDCDLTDAGAVEVNIDRSIVAQNEFDGIGGPPPDPGQTVTVTKTSCFGNTNVNYESTLFTGGKAPGGNFATTVDPLLDAVTFAPDSCSPVFNVGECASPAGQICFSSSSLAALPAPPACGAGGCVFQGAGHIENPDVNEDNLIDGVDLLRLAVAFASMSNELPTPPDPRYNAGVDFDRNGVVDGNDLLFVTGSNFGRICP